MAACSSTDLRGLAALRSVTGQFVIRQNDRLTSLGGFDSLTSVGGRVAVSANPLLLDVDLSAIASSDEFLLHRNSLLGGTAQLSAAYRATEVSVIGNPQLIDLAMLPIGAPSIVSVIDNDALVTLASLPARPVDALYVSGNAGLRATGVGITGAAYIRFWANGATSLTFGALLGSTQIDIDENASLTSVSAPLLTQADLLFFDNASLTSISFPAAVSVFDIDVELCPGVNLLSFGALTQVTDDIRYVGTPSPDATESVDMGTTTSDVGGNEDTAIVDLSESDMTAPPEDMGTVPDLGWTRARHSQPPLALHLRGGHRDHGRRPRRAEPRQR